MPNCYESKHPGPYQELEEFHGPDLNAALGNTRNNNEFDNSVDRSMELNNTVIVPDGKYTFLNLNNIS